MERYWLPACFLLMHAAWIAGAATVAAVRLSTGGPIAPLPVAVVTVGAGWAAGGRLLRRAVESDDAEQPSRREAAIPALALGVGASWSVGAVWLARHAGEGADWIAALPNALTGTAARSAGDALSLLVVFALWWRGQRSGAVPPQHDSTVRGFGTGAIALAASLLIGAGLRSDVGALGACIVLFLGAGLPALSLARLGEVRQDLMTGAVRGEPARLDAAWRRTLLPPVLVVLACGMLAAVLFGDATWRGAMAQGLGRAGGVLLAVLYWPVFAVGLLAEWLIVVLRRFMRPGQDVEREAPVANEGEDLLDRLRRTEIPRLEWLWVVEWAAAALVVAVVVYAFLASARVVRRVRRDAEGAVPRSEALGGWSLLLADLRGALRELLRRIRRRGALLAAGVAMPGVLRGTPRAPEIADARGAYRALLTLGRGQGVARRPAQTPDEYLVAWRAELPEEEAAAELTGAYRRARYGLRSQPETPPGQLRGLIARVRDAIAARAQAR